jgi:hypothetical protein
VIGPKWVRVATAHWSLGSRKREITDPGGLTHPICNRRHHHKAGQAMTAQCGGWRGIVADQHVPRDRCMQASLRKACKEQGAGQAVCITTIPLTRARQAADRQLQTSTLLGTDVLMRSMMGRHYAYSRQLRGGPAQHLHCSCVSQGQQWVPRTWGDVMYRPASSHGFAAGSPAPWCPCNMKHG